MFTASIVVGVGIHIIELHNWGVIMVSFFCVEIDLHSVEKSMIEVTWLIIRPGGVQRLLTRHVLHLIKSSHPSASLNYLLK